ncbi:MAG: GerMN domain-containing protein [Spirochaetales bacterium]|nr:GerMN domain-containing protein [Spirochaetales bacterium]
MSKGKKASLGCLFWIALILLVVVVFLYNQDNVSQFISMIYNPETQAPAPAPLVTRDPVDQPEPSPLPQTETGHDDRYVTVTVNDEEEATPAPQQPAVSPTPKPVTETEQPIALDPAGIYKNAHIYFVDAKNIERMVLKSVARKVNYKDTPLTETLNYLIKGPSTSEVQSSLTSLIPKGTQIRSISVKGDTAYINLNDEFRFNNYGLPGLEAQLKQLVYTTTEFANITRVQILIDGKKVNYLAQEGIYVGAPISRSSF